MPQTLGVGEPESLKLTTPIPLIKHPAATYLNSLAPGSKPTMENSLNAIAYLLTRGECDAMTLDWSKLRYHHTSTIRTILKEKYAPATANKMLCALRRVLKEALRLDLIDPYDHAKAVDLATITNRRQLRGRALTKEEIAQLLAICLHDPTGQGVRDAALVAVLRGAGVRRAEVAKLELKDFNPETGQLEVYRGKGDKDRLVYLPGGAVDLVLSWLKLRGNAPGALLCPIRKGGQIQLRAMCPDAVLKIIRRRAKEAGIESFSPHDFRRTFCSDLLDAGIDIVTVQKLAGHASPTTTAKYDRRGEEVKRQAVQKLDFS